MNSTQVFWINLTQDQKFRLFSIAKENGISMSQSIEMLINIYYKFNSVVDYLPSNFFLC